MRAERLVALLFTLQQRRTSTVPELAAALDVSERTMHRDIAVLKELGVPIWTEQGRAGGIRLVDGWRSRLDGLTAREAVSLLAMGAPRELDDLGLGTALAAAHAKLSATLPTSVREQVQAVSVRFHLDAPGWFRAADDDEHLATVARALWAGRRLQVSYDRDSGVVERTLDPLGLVLKAGIWYLVAQAEQDIRTYRVQRLSRAVILAEEFERPPTFSLAAWWSQSSTRFARSLQRESVRVRLSPRGVRAFPRLLDPDLVSEALSNATAPDADGWVEVVVGLEEPTIAAGQLLAFGPDVEVLGPEAVRTAYVSAVQAMLDRHR